MNYFYKGMKLPPYISLPKFLLQTELSLNTQMVYALLLGRSNISASEKIVTGGRMREGQYLSSIR